MINLKIWKKRVSLFFLSKYFFSFLIISIFLYAVSIGYSYIQNIQNNQAFVSLYSLLERYQGAVNSTSSIPLEELLKDIEIEKKKLGFFCSIKDQFIFLEASILLQCNKIENALSILKQTVSNDLNNELNYLYHLVIAIAYATSGDINKKQEGIALLKKYAACKKFQDIAIFYYGYFLLKTTSLEQADQAWLPLKHDPQFNNSPYKLLVEQARNCDY
jgi:hypothetical protein